MGADFDVVVIGAGFGGMGAALFLAEAGARVCLLESLNYAGGCASTFRRAGYAFESGATLFSGFAPGQLFHQIIERHGLPVEVDMLRPMVRLRTPGHELLIEDDRSAIMQQLVDAGVPREPLARFAARQRKVADALWGLFDDPALLPPFSPARLVSHVARAPGYAPILPLVGRPLGDVLAKDGLHRPSLFKAYLDAVCQITVQCDATSAEAPFALSTLDYYHRGTGHVRGGIGSLTNALVDLLRSLGVEVRLSARARALTEGPRGWTVEGRSGAVHAPVVIANLLPQNLRALLGAPVGARPVLDRAAARVESGWGAVMHYLVVAPPADADAHAVHLELVDDPEAPFVDGNHVFCSISGAQDEGRAPAGLRTMTMSTHVALGELRRLSSAEQARRIEQVQLRMRRTLQARAPEWVRDVRYNMTASPRTFERFTGRFAGYVGGVPRRAGLHNYEALISPAPAPGLFMVGDSVFPGQSTLATMVGGVKAAERALRRLSGRALATPTRPVADFDARAQRAAG